MEILVFQSCGYHFGLPASMIQKVSIEKSENPLSFSSAVLQKASPQENSFILLNSGAVLAVDEIGEILHYEKEILPLPGYIFSTDENWLAGLLWDSEPKILLMNSVYLRACIS